MNVLKPLKMNTCLILAGTSFVKIACADYSESRWMITLNDRPRKVMAINESGEHKLFSSSTDASKKMNIKRSRIIECLQGKRTKAGGYIWQYI